MTIGVASEFVRDMGKSSHSEYEAIIARDLAPEDLIALINHRIESDWHPYLTVGDVVLLRRKPVDWSKIEAK